MFDVNIFFKFACFALTLIFLTNSFNFVAVFLILVILVYEFKNNRSSTLQLLGMILTGVILFYCTKKYQSGNLSLTGMIIKSEENYFLVKTFRATYFIALSNNQYEVGDIVHLAGIGSKLEFYHYQESFDFSKYLNSYGAYTEVKSYKIEIIIKNPIRIKAFKECLLSGYSSEAKMIIGSMLFKDSASKSQAFSAASILGISYLLSSSNIHISFLFYAISNLAKRKLKEDKINKFCLLLLSVIFVFSEFSISIERIWLMYVLTQLNYSKIKTNFNYVERLSIAGIIILLLHPFYVLNIGFYYIFPTLIVFSFIVNTFAKRASYKKVKICLVFFLLMLPYHMIADHSFNILSLVFQIVSAPVFSVVYLLDYLVFFGQISRPFLEILNSSISIFLTKISNINIVVPVGNYGYVDALIYYGVVLLVVIFKELKFKKHKQVCILLLIITFFINVFPNYKNYYEVHFIDVGQGDSTLIRYKNKNILVDTGGSLYVDLATKCLVPYFRKLKINKLDAVLTTHEDYDHVGALDSLEKNFKIKKIYRGGNEQKLFFGDFVIEDINIYKDWSNEDINYTSAVYSFKIKATSFLIMGDAPIEIEKKLIKKYQDLKCDVLKVGHHGSDTSSCFEFLNQVDPKFAVISCGYNNLYGHPKQSVLDNLNRLNIPYTRTDIASTYIYKLGA